MGAINPLSWRCELFKASNRSPSIRRRTAIFACLLLLTLTLSGCDLITALSAIPGAGGTWSGTIVISRVGESTQTTGEGTCCPETTQRTLNDVVTVEVVNNQATCQVSYNYAEHLISRIALDPGTNDIVVDTVTAGSGEDIKGSQVTVSLAEDGSYEIEVEFPPVDGTWTQDSQDTLTCNWTPPGCTPYVNQDQQTATAPDLSGASEVVDGQITPGGPAVLSGTKTDKIQFSGGSEGTFPSPGIW